MSRTLVQSFLFGREHQATTREVPWSRLILVGRVLLATIFVISGVSKLLDWSMTAGYMRSAGLPVVDLLLPIAAAIEILGGLSLVTGTYTRLGAAALILYLIPTTLVFHHFWTWSGAARQMQMVNFLKNLSIMGGLLVLLGQGAGRFSFDAKIKQHIDRTTE